MTAASRARARRRGSTGRASVVRSCAPRSPTCRRASAVSPTGSLPYAFPTLDGRRLRRRRSRRSVQPESPPPQEVSRRRDELRAALRARPRRLLHARGRASDLRSRHGRRDAHATSRGTAAASSWSSGSARDGDRIYGRNGKVDAAYRPESTAASSRRAASPSSRWCRLLGGRCRRRAGALQRLPMPGRPRVGTADVGPCARAVLRRAGARRCCARAPAALSSTGGWRLTRSTAPERRRGRGLEEDWCSASATKRPCRARRSPSPRSSSGRSSASPPRPLRRRWRTATGPRSVARSTTTGTPR